MVKARMPEASFAVAGEGPPDWMSRSPDIHFLGSRPHAEVEQLYALSDVVAHPAVWPEPFSRVPLEAAAFARPVVGTRIGGTPEAVEDKSTGLLVERSDAPALAHALEELLVNGELRLSLGRQASETVLRKFSEDRVVADLLAAYAKARS